MAPGDFTFDKRAYHDEKTGHYTMPEPDNSIPAAFQDASGLWLPKPNVKEVTLINFDFPGKAMEVGESVDEVLEKLSGTEEYVEFTHAVYQDAKIVVNRKSAKAHVLIVETTFKDMDAVRQDMDMQALNRRMQAQQMEKARVATLGRNNRRN